MTIKKRLTKTKIVMITTVKNVHDVSKNSLSKILYY